MKNIAKTVLLISMLLAAAAPPVSAQFRGEDLVALELEGSIRSYKKLGISLGLGGYYYAVGISLHCNLNKNLNVRAAAGSNAAGVQLRWMFYEENLSPYIGIGYLGTGKNGTRDTFNMMSFGIEMINANGTTLGIEISPLFLGEDYSSERAPYSIDGYVGYFF
jgi:hypothetical protein